MMSVRCERGEWRDGEKRCMCRFENQTKPCRRFGFRVPMTPIMRKRDVAQREVLAKTISVA